MILWGNVFPKIQLREKIWDEEFTTGSTLPDTIQLAHTDIVEDSETVTNLDGTVTYEKDKDYTMDYENGRIEVLDSGAMQPDTTYKIDYEYVYQEKTLDASTGTNVWIEWIREVLGRMITQDGEELEWSAGWRMHCKIVVTEFDVYTVTDFLRMAYSWPSTDRRIILYPRPNYLPGYEVLPDMNYSFKYPNNVWKGQILEVSFRSKKLFGNIPPHTGGTGDA